jgi:hypothetical protein
MNKKRENRSAAGKLIQTVLLKGESYEQFNHYLGQFGIEEPFLSPADSGGHGHHQFQAEHRQKGQQRP